MLAILFGGLYYLDITSSCTVILHLCLNGMSRQLWLTNNVQETQIDILPRGWIQRYRHKYALENWGRGLKFFHFYLFTKHSKKKIIIVLQKHSCVWYFKQSKKIKCKMRFYLSKLVCPHPGLGKFQPPAIWLSTPFQFCSGTFSVSVPHSFSYLFLQLFPRPSPALPPGCSISVANNSFLLPCGRGACISKDFCIE